MVRELVGHGLGRHLHEDPQVPNYGRRGSGAVLKEGLVLAIEPMINLGKKMCIPKMTAGPFAPPMANLLFTLNTMCV